MKIYKVLMTQPAADDLKGISAYISNELREPVAAKKLVNKIKEAVTSFSELPTRHALISDEYLAAVGIRRIMIDNYMIFYIVSEKDATVTVVRILNGKREWVYLL